MLRFSFGAVLGFPILGLAPLLGCSATGGSGGASSSTTSSTISATTSSGSGGAGAGTSAGGAGSATGGTGGATGGAGGSTTTSSATGGAGGTVDPSTLDQDGDGWTPAQGDCCDVPSAACTQPKLVNPGAFEYPGNGVDDDCDPTTSDTAAPASCSPAAMWSGVAADDLLRAMDLCQFADDPPATPQARRWGVVTGSAQLLLADGVTPLPAADAVQVGVLAGFGTNVAPRKGATMGAISSGTARTPTDPGYVHPQNGPQAGQTGNYNAMTQVAIQGGYLAAHGGVPPSAASCSVTCSGAGCDQAYDSVDLRARVRAPTNAQSFSYAFKFYSAEFPEHRCQQYNDFFITLLKSSWVPDPLANPPQQQLPADGNIAFDAAGNPVSVNNGFFQVCFPPTGAPAGTCPSGTLELIGNGMGGWGSDVTDGGGTDWLTNTAPVVPGEIIEIQFVIWDAGDHNVDSLVLLDNFRWSVTASPVGVHK